MSKKNAKPDYEDSKRNPLLKVKSAKLRQRENYGRITRHIGRLKQVLESPSLHHWEAVEMAAENLANQPVGGIDRFLVPLAHVFFEPLEYCCATYQPIDSYWHQFIELVEACDSSFAQALLAGGYEQSFRWLAFGQVQRLAVLYGERPEAVGAIEIYQDSNGKNTSIAVCNNGDSFVIPEDYFNEAPEVYFPGDRFTLPFHPDDSARLKSAILVPAALESMKPRPNELVRQTLLVNVSLPEDLSLIAQRMNQLPFPKNVAQIRANRRNSSSHADCQSPQKP